VAVLFGRGNIGVVVVSDSDEKLYFVPDYCSIQIINKCATGQSYVSYIKRIDGLNIMNNNTCAFHSLKKKNVLFLRITDITVCSDIARAFSRPIISQRLKKKSDADAPKTIQTAQV
jgi:hypothetical protein